MAPSELPEYMQSTVTFYDNIAEQFMERTITLQDTDWLERFAALLPSGGKVLDAGCAGGRDCLWFVKRNFDTYGIDMSPKMIAYAKDLVRDAKFSVMNLLQMDFTDQYFDGLWCSCALPHISKADLPKAFEEFNRLLKPSGILFALLKEGTGEGIQSDSRYSNAKRFTSNIKEEELLQIAAVHGFEPITVFETHEKVDYCASDRIFALFKKITDDLQFSLE